MTLCPLDFLSVAPWLPSPHTGVSSCVTFLNNLTLFIDFSRIWIFFRILKIFRITISAHWSVTLPHLSNPILILIDFSWFRRFLRIHKIFRISITRHSSVTTHQASPPSILRLPEITWDFFWIIWNFSINLINRLNSMILRISRSRCSILDFQRNCGPIFGY